MKRKAVHFRRYIRHCPNAQWIHCGRDLNTVESTCILADVTCRVCGAYVEFGIQAGYQQSASAVQMQAAHEASRRRHDCSRA